MRDLITPFLANLVEQEAGGLLEYLVKRMVWGLWAGFQYTGWMRASRKGKDP